MTQQEIYNVIKDKSARELVTEFIFYRTLGHSLDSSILEQLQVKIMEKGGFIITREHFDAIDMKNKGVWLPGTLANELDNGNVIRDSIITQEGQVLVDGITLIILD